MLGISSAPRTISTDWTADTMTTRTAALITIGLIAVLLASVALAAMMTGDISERVGGIVTSVLGSFATVMAGLLLFLRVETVNAKVDDAASNAEIAAKRAQVVESKVESVHHDLLNRGLRANVIQAIRETETDPEIVEQRASNAALGVKMDRHETLSREQAAYARGVRDAIRQLEQEPDALPEGKL